jgi:hypothetical protein
MREASSYEAPRHPMKVLATEIQRHSPTPLANTSSQIPSFTEIPEIEPESPCLYDRIAWDLFNIPKGCDEVGADAEFY